jgi:hypothetical protein
MPNPLWVDARDYLTNKGVPVTTGNLNSAMGFLAQNLNARPSYAKASPDAATSIGAGLGMPTDDLVTPVDDPSFQDSAQYIPNAVSSSGQFAHGGTTGYSPDTVKATPLPGSVSYKPTSYTPPQTQARPQPRSQGPANRTEKTASTRSQPKTLPTNNRTETASARSDPIVSPVSTGSDPNIHGTPANVAPVAAAPPSNVNPAIPDVSNGAYAPGGLEDAGLGTAASVGGGLGAALLAMILSRGRAGRVPNAPRIPGVGASPLGGAVATTRLPPGSPPRVTGPTPITGPAPITGPTPVGAPPPVYTPTGPAIPQSVAPRVQLPTGSPPPVYVPPAMMGPPPIRPTPPVRGPQPVSGTMEDILTAQKPKAQTPPPPPKAPAPKPTAKAAAKKKAAKK